MQAVSISTSPTNSIDSRSSTVHDEIPEDVHEQMMAKLKIKEDEEEEEAFSFACTIPDGSPISADDAFDNGQIRPIYPVFDRNLLFSDGYDGSSTLRPPLKKVFVEQRCRSSSSSSSSLSSSSASESDEPDVSPEAMYCEWSRKTAMEASSAKCDKSNSTGFSKLWRFRETKLRSNSDGKDAFVFLNSSEGKTAGESRIPGEKAAAAKAKASSGEAKKVKGGNGKTTSSSLSSAHERHYVMNRAKKESDKRKSYLPYKQDMFGIFANVNGFSRNVHPF